MKLCLGVKPVIEKEFFQYPLALEKALKGEDCVRVLETAYSDLSIPFPYARPQVQELHFCCKHWKITDHDTRNCKLTKAEAKSIKKKFYQENPDKKAYRNRVLHQKEKTSEEKRKKRNKRNAESKKRNLPESFVQRRETWFRNMQELKNNRGSGQSMKFQRTTNEIQERQLSRGIVLGNRRKQYVMLMRQKYREQVNAFVNDHDLN